MGRRYRIASGPGQTRVTLTGVGYKPGEPYDTLLRHFTWGNAVMIAPTKIERLIDAPARP